jgi:hypothetical protein
VRQTGCAHRRGWQRRRPQGCPRRSMSCRSLACSTRGMPPRAHGVSHQWLCRCHSQTHLRRARGSHQPWIACVCHGPRCLAECSTLGHQARHRPICTPC